MQQKMRDEEKNVPFVRFSLFFFVILQLDFVVTIKQDSIIVTIKTRDR